MKNYVFFPQSPSEGTPPWVEIDASTDKDASKKVEKLVPGDLFKKIPLMSLSEESGLQSK